MARPPMPTDPSMREVDAGATPRLARLDIFTRHRQRIASAPFAELTVIRILSGRKRVDDGLRSVELGTGHYLAVGAGQLLNVENIPGQNGTYAATCLAIANPLPPPRSERPASSPWKRLLPSDPLDQAFAHTEQGLRGTLPDALLRHRIDELLEALAWSGFVPRASGGQALVDRVRILLASAPGDDWHAGDVAARLAMSPATLRRKLAAEGAGFRRVLDEVRLGHALALVQGSRQPLKWVALSCGYQSASRFAERFRERFGCLPSELRGNASDDPPTDGTAVPGPRHLR